MEIQKFVLGVIAKMHNIPELEVAEALKSDGGDDDIDLQKAYDYMLDKDKERVKTLKKSNFDEGHKKAKKEVLSTVESALKSKLGITDDLEGDDLIDHIVTLKAPDAGGTVPKTEEELKKHPFVIGLQNSHRVALEAKDQEWSGKLTAKEEETKHAALFSDVRAIALRALDAKNPILPKDPEKAAKAKERLLVKELEGFKFLKQGSEITVLDTDGKPLDDGHGNPKQLSALVDEVITSNFELAVADQRENSGAGKGGGQADPPAAEAWTGKLPANNDEYLAILTDPKVSTEQKVSMKRQYEKKLGK